MAGNYTLQQYTISDTKIIPDTDGPDHYCIFYNGNIEYISKSDYSMCHIGDCVVEVKVDGIPIYSVLLLIDTSATQPFVVRQNLFNSIFKLR